MSRLLIQSLYDKILKLLTVSAQSLAVLATKYQDLRTKTYQCGVPNKHNSKI